jgi:hypothetical protein
MNNNEKFLELKNRFDELQHQYAMIMREETILLEELKKVCPHEDTSEPFTMAPYSCEEVQICNVCKKTLFHNHSQDTWE